MDNGKREWWMSIINDKDGVIEERKRKWERERQSKRKREGETERKSEREKETERKSAREKENGG